MAPGSPKVVLVSTPSSSEGTPPYRVGHRVSHGTDHGQEQVEQIKCKSASRSCLLNSVLSPV